MQLNRRISQAALRPFVVILRDGRFFKIWSPQCVLGRSADEFVVLSHEYDECAINYRDVVQLMPLNVVAAAEYAESILPGAPVRNGRDPRWLAIILLGEFIESAPEPIWHFVNKWGRHRQRDLRDAIATCLLEHLLEHHFADYFPLVQEAARGSANFGDTFLRCWKFGQSNARGNSQRFNRLLREVEIDRERRRNKS